MCVLKGFFKGRITMNHLDKKCYMNFIVKTLSETTAAPANQWFEDDFPFGMAYFLMRFG